MSERVDVGWPTWRYFSRLICFRPWLWGPNLASIILLISDISAGEPAWDAVSSSTVVVPGHCTGWQAANLIVSRLPHAYVQSNVGTRLHFAGVAAQDRAAAMRAGAGTSSETA